MADVRRWRTKDRVEVVAANLYSELLIETLPGLTRCLAAPGWIIASGIMRSQERDVLHALKEHGFQVKEIRRRGKWIALAAKLRTKRGRAGGIFLRPHLRPQKPC
jgi:ribosomal protein L11 methyltransferase